MSKQIKKVVINAKDLWTALTNCDQMSLLRKYFIHQDIYASTLFHDATFDEKTGDVIFTAKHKSFPIVEDNTEVPTYRLPGLRNKNEEVSA